MKTELFFGEFGVTAHVTPETVKEAATLAYINRNLVPEARRVAQLVADVPLANDLESPLTFVVNLATKSESKRTSKM